MAKLQTDRRKQKLDELVQLGDRLAQKLDAKMKARPIEAEGPVTRVPTAASAALFMRPISAGSSRRNSTAAGLPSVSTKTP